MKREFSALQEQAFDLLVYGGIYGTWTAYDAALRGLKVALVASVLCWDAGRVAQEVEACKQ